MELNEFNYTFVILTYLTEIFFHQMRHQISSLSSRRHARKNEPLPDINTFVKTISLDIRRHFCFPFSTESVCVSASQLSTVSPSTSSIRERLTEGLVYRSPPPPSPTRNPQPPHTPPLYFLKQRSASAAVSNAALGEASGNVTGRTL